MPKPLLQFTNKGIYCAQADVYIDPWRKVKNAIITHAHADHSRKGMEHYLTHHYSIPIMKARLGNAIQTQGVDYGEAIYVNGVKISLHPAGHVVGSAQVRVEYKGEVWVASGDYKVEDDGVSTAFEPVKCNGFITECTFGLPIYQWQQQAVVMEEVMRWWQQNKQEDVVSVIGAYSLGKAQRVLVNLEPIGKIYVHKAVWNMNKAIEASGIDLKNDYLLLDEKVTKADLKGAMVISSSVGNITAKRYGKISLASCSGWMQLRGRRRWGNLDKGFVLSDHADWIGLNAAIEATEAEQVVCTHGYNDTFAKWLQTKGIQAITEQTQFGEEEAL